MTVFEAGRAVGGMCRTLTLWGMKADVGPHRFFSTNKKVNDLWVQVVGKDYTFVNRLTRIFYKNTFYAYPVSAMNVLRNLGIFETMRCLASYMQEKLHPVYQKSTFETWVISRFGRRLYEIFFKTYSEKLWGISCNQLDADFAKQRIKKFSLLEAIKNTFYPTSHPTLLDSFAYPRKGTGFVYSQMAKKIKQSGGTIILNVPVKRVLIRGMKACGIELLSGEKYMFDHIISTMPITRMVIGLPNVTEKVARAVSKLRFRNTIIVYLCVSRTDLFPDQWIYIHAQNVKVGRITNFRNWVPELYGDKNNTILAMEYWFHDEDLTWRETDEKQLLDLAGREIVEIGLARKEDIVSGKIYKIPKCYPIYDRNYKKNLSIVVTFLENFHNLHVLGRGGAFKYNNQDHSILMGILAAENIAECAKHNLWVINTDTDYQEGARITETGLIENTFRSI